MATRVLAERQGNVMIWRLEGDNELQILDRMVLVELRRMLDHLYGDSSLVALILTGTGTRAFSAGANLHEVRQLTPLSAQEFSHLGQSVTSLLADFPAPVIAAINGLAFGGGLELALACDFRIAAPHVRFAYPASKLGILPGFGGTQRCPLLVGPSRAKELMFFGRELDALSAEAWGLINALAEDPLAEAQRWASELAERDGFAIRQIKDCIGMTERMDFFFEQEAFGNCFRQSTTRTKLMHWQEVTSGDR